MTEINQSIRPRGLPSNDAIHMTAAEIRRRRFEDDATRILENDLHRRRWSSVDRDAIACSLEAIFERERKIRQ